MTYKRILLKLSGEVFAGNAGHGYSKEIFEFIINEIKKVKSKGIEVALVVGGGNIYRGRESEELGIEPLRGHYMGMLATAMNAISLESYFNNNGVKAKALSTLYLDNVIEKFSSQKARDFLSQGYVVIFACGTGNPFFTTDTGASLKAIEIGADLLIKGTSVDGIYDKDPKTNPDAKFFEQISYNEVLEKNLKIMDSTSISMCRDNKMPVVVYNMKKQDLLLKIVSGEKVGSKIY